MPAIRRPAATTRSPRLPKIIRAPSLRRSQAVLLTFEDPLVAVDDDRVTTAPRLAWHLRRPLDRVAEPGVEGTEVLGRVHDRVAVERVLDVRGLDEVIEEPTGVVVVDRDE